MSVPERLGGVALTAVGHNDLLLHIPFHSLSQSRAMLSALRVQRVALRNGKVWSIIYGNIGSERLIMSPHFFVGLRSALTAT